MLLQCLQCKIKGRKVIDDFITIAYDFITKPEAYQKFEFRKIISNAEGWGEDSWVKNADRGFCPGHPSWFVTAMLCYPSSDPLASRLLSFVSTSAIVFFCCCCYCLCRLKNELNLGSWVWGGYFCGLWFFHLPGILEKVCHRCPYKGNSKTRNYPYRCFTVI